MKPRELAVLSVGIVAAAALPLLLMSRRDRIPEPPVVVDKPTVQAQRVQEFIREAESLKSFQSAVASLEARESDVASMAITSAELETSEVSSKVIMNAVLADRRVSRAFWHLGEMEPPTARKECLALYEKSLAGLTSEWNKFAPLVKETRGPWVCLDLHRRHHALSAAVFLCTTFCRYEDARGLCQRWRTQMDSALRETGFDPVQYEKETGVPVVDIFPDELFELNVAAILLAQKGDGFFAIQERTTVPLPAVIPRQYLAWDEVHRPETRKDASVEREVLYLPGWSPLFLPESKQQAMDVVRASLSAD